MSNDPCNVALVGTKFMGRAHSNAYLKVGKFFDLPVTPVMHTVAARSKTETEEFAARWGWHHASTDWKEAIANPEINLVDVVTPNNVHHEHSIAALEAGKNVACGKAIGQYAGQCAADGRGRGKGTRKDVRLVQLPTLPRGCFGPPNLSAGETRSHLSNSRLLPPGLGRSRYAADVAIRRRCSWGAVPLATCVPTPSTPLGLSPAMKSARWSVRRWRP